MRAAKYRITCSGRKIPWSDNFDGLIWGTWEGDDRDSVSVLLDNDRQIKSDSVVLLNSIGACPSDRCNRGIFVALEADEIFNKRDNSHPPQQPAE